eukprot:13893376-Alexandrium_andersonii.AAC.1
MHPGQHLIPNMSSRARERNAGHFCEQPIEALQPAVTAEGTEPGHAATSGQATPVPSTRGKSPPPRQPCL